MAEEKEFVNFEIYKKWFRTKEKQGFCSITAWFEGQKVVIDIGEVTSETKATKCFVDAYDFLTWAKAVRDGRATTLYPPNDREQRNTPEAFTSFGGSGDVARVFKAHWWNTARDGKDATPGGGFAFKCGHFKGRTTGQGAIIPDFQSPLSINQIKMTHVEVATVANRLDHALLMWGSNNPDYQKHLFGGS